DAVAARDRRRPAEGGDSAHRRLYATEEGKRRPMAPVPSSRSRRRSRRSLARGWLEKAAHPLLTLVVVLSLEAAATGGLVWWAGWDEVWRALSAENARWFALCGAGQLFAYVGYALSLRAAAAVDRGVELSFPAALAVVSVGFGPMFSANTSGGFSVDYITLREAGMSARRAFRRVLGLSALEYAVLAPAVALCGLLVYLGVGGSASAGVTLPWLAVIPGALAAWWLTAPGRRRRFESSTGAGALRRGVAHFVAALAILRALIEQWRAYAWAFGGAFMYWLGDIATFWAA